MKSLSVKLVGLQPGLIVHRFSDEDAESATSGVRGNRNKELTPREAAQQYLYTDADGNVGIPGMNIYRAIIDAGSLIKVGRKALSTQRSSQIPSMMWITDEFCRIDPGEWETDSRPVVIPATNGRILRHRPRFDVWSLRINIDYDDSLISLSLINDLLVKCGSCIGIGDFRPARRGPFGRFTISM